MINSFLETALWSTRDYDSDDSMDDMLDAKYCIYDISDDFKAKSQELIDLFMERANHLFTQDELDNNPIGHDLWLTIEGHGAGFWDGDYTNGDELTAICKELVPYSNKFSDMLNESINRNHK